MGRPSMSKLYQNAVLVDGKHIMRSAHRHDYVAYDGLVLDGGTDYRRTGGDPLAWAERVVDLALYESDTIADAVGKLTMRTSIGSSQWMLVSDADTEKLMLFYDTINKHPVLRPVLLAVLHHVLSTRVEDLASCVIDCGLHDTIQDVLALCADRETVERTEATRYQQVLQYLVELTKDPTDDARPGEWSDVDA